MYTVIDFIERCPAELKILLRERVKNPHRSCESLGQAIDHGFQWSQTEEGEDFWQVLCDKYNSVTFEETTNIEFGEPNSKKVEEKMYGILPDGRAVRLSQGIGKSIIFRDLFGLRDILTESYKSISEKEFLKKEKEHNQMLENIFSYDMEKHLSADFMNIDYSKPVSNYRFSQNLLIQGVKSGDIFIKYKTHTGNEIFDNPIETAEELRLIVPYDWLAVCNYNENFLKKYLCEINRFELGVVNFSVENNKEFERYYFKGKRFDNSVINDKFVSFEIKAKNENSLEIILILLTDLYYYKYNNIPGQFMQMTATNYELSSWTIFLLLKGISIPDERIFANGIAGFELVPNAYSEVNTLNVIRKRLTGKRLHEIICYIAADQQYMKNEIFEKENKEAIKNYNKLIKTES